LTKDGAMSVDGRIWGCYLHGIFANDAFRCAWLQSLGWVEAAPVNSSRILDKEIDRLTDIIANSLDLERLDRIIAGEDLVGLH
jgi:adenosylcobyric acid synthase